MSSSHPPPPKADLRIADYFCITEPCYGLSKPFVPPGPVGGLLGGATSFLRKGQQWLQQATQVEPTIAALPPWLVDSDLGDSVQVPEETPQAALQSPDYFENAEINPLRPVVTVTAAERDQFYSDRASILARYPGFVSGAESDPIFIITDDPSSGKVPSPVTNTVAPPLLGVVGQTDTYPVASIGAVTGSPSEGGSRSGFGEQSMGWLADFGQSLLGSVDFDPSTPGIFQTESGAGVTSLPDLIGGLAGSYITGRVATPGINQAGPLPPYINPQTRVTTTNVTPMRTTAVGCISQRDIDIAAATGASPELVDVILKLGRRNRRRKRMLTKSDIGDISTMRQILGGGEAFKVWLAKATR